MAGIFRTGEIDCLMERNDSSVMEMPISDNDMFWKINADVHTGAPFH